MEGCKALAETLALFEFETERVAQMLSEKDDLMAEDDRPLTTDEALAYLASRGVLHKKSTLRSYCCLGIGPRYYLDARRPRFLKPWLDQYIAERRRAPVPRGGARDACAA